MLFENSKSRFSHDIALIMLYVNILSIVILGPNMTVALEIYTLPVCMCSQTVFSLSTPVYDVICFQINNFKMDGAVPAVFTPMTKDG